MWRGFKAEIFGYAIWSLMFGLFLFDVIGGKTTYECIATKERDTPMFKLDLFTKRFPNYSNATE